MNIDVCGGQRGERRKQNQTSETMYKIVHLIVKMKYVLICTGVHHQLWIPTKAGTASGQQISPAQKMTFPFISYTSVSLKFPVISIHQVFKLVRIIWKESREFNVLQQVNILCCYFSLLLGHFLFQCEITYLLISHETLIRNPCFLPPLL